jgi:excinuclease UvrABC ATPase subunit
MTNIIITGYTGSGKSYYLHNVVLPNIKPKLMIDFKRVELSQYSTRCKVITESYEFDTAIFDPLKKGDIVVIEEACDFFRSVRGSETIIQDCIDRGVKFVLVMQNTLECKLDLINFKKIRFCNHDIRLALYEYVAC